MYSRHLLNRTVNMKSLLTSATIASVRRRRQIGGIKYFSIVRKHDYFRMYTSIKQPRFVSRIFCKKYSQSNSNPTESSTQKPEEDNQNQSSDETPMSLCLKLCGKQSYQVYELNIQNSAESDDCVECGVQMSQLFKGNNDKDIIDDKNGFCRAICLLPSLPDKTITPVKTVASGRKVADAKNVESAQTLSSSQSVPYAPTIKATRTDSCDKVIIADKNEFCNTICPPPALSDNTVTTEINDALNKNVESPQTVASNLIVASAVNVESKPKYGERLIDKLTAEEIEEICNAKCSSNTCQELPKASVEKVSSKHLFEYGSYSSNLTELPLFGDKFHPKGKEVRMRKERRTAGQIRKIIPPASFPAQRHSYLSPGQRIIPSNQNIVNLVPDIRYGVHPCPAIPYEARKVQLKSVPQFMSHHMRKQKFSGRRADLNVISGQRIFHSNQKIGNVIPGIRYRVPFRPEIPDRDKGPQTQFRSSYGRMIRSLEKEKRLPIVIFPQIGRLNNASNSGHFGYERIPYMPSNQLFNQTKQRKHASFPQHRHTNKPTGTIFSDRPRRVQSPIPSIPIGPKSNIPNNLNIFKPIKNPNPNQTHIDAAKSQITSVKNPDKPGVKDFKLIENRSAMVYGPRKLKLISSGYPQIRNDKDVIIRMEYVNLTDADARHYVTGNDNPYSFITTVAGRTGTGQIIEVGSAVTNVKPGDKVLIKRVSCGKCSLCLNDRGRLCESLYVSGMSSERGTLTHFYVHPSEFLTKIPNNVKPINAAMASTMSSAIRACQKASLTAGDNVMVINGGPLGTATVLAAKSMGATSITLADARKPILDKALKLDIDHTFLIDPRSPFRNTAMQIGEKIGGYPRLVFDCNGSQLTNQIAIYAAKTGGKVIIMRNDGSQSMISVTDAIMRDVDIIISTIGNDESERAALQFLKSGKMLINTDSYHHYDLSNVNEAFQHLLDPNRLGSSHVIVECQINNDEQKNKNDNENGTKIS